MLQMSLRACLVAGLLAFLPASAMAKTYKITPKNPVAEITIPDDWDTSTIENGIESTSDDEEIYFAVEMTSWKNLEKNVEEWAEWLVSKKVEIDPKSQKTEAFEVNGLKGVELHWKGKDEDGPTEVSLAIFQITENRALLVTFWGSEDGQKENADDLLKIMKSLKKLD